MKNLPIIDKRRSVPKINMSGLSQIEQTNDRNERKVQQIFRGAKVSRNSTLQKRGEYFWTTQAVVDLGANEQAEDEYIMLSNARSQGNTQNSSGKNMRYKS